MQTDDGVQVVFYSIAGFLMTRMLVAAGLIAAFENSPSTFQPIVSPIRQTGAAGFEEIPQDVGRVESLVTESTSSPGSH